MTCAVIFHPWKFDLLNGAQTRFVKQPRFHRPVSDVKHSRTSGFPWLIGCWYLLAGILLAGYGTRRIGGRGRAMGQRPPPAAHILSAKEHIRVSRGRHA